MNWLETLPSVGSSNTQYISWGNVFYNLPEITNIFLNTSGDKWTPNKKLKKGMARRKDGVDEKYRDCYRRWAGRTYKGKHPSHLVQGEKKVFPHNQLILGYCLLCPMTSLIPTNYRYKRHFRLCHIKHAVLIAKITLLACKCSQVKSQGTDYSCRNQHYHCHLCHWPKTSKQALFIHYNTQHDLPIEVIGHLVDKPKKIKQ